MRILESCLQEELNKFLEHIIHDEEQDDIK